MKDFFRDFGFSRKEKNAFVVFLTITFLLSVFFGLYPKFKAKKSINLALVNLPSFREDEGKEFGDDLVADRLPERTRGARVSASESFDPNTLTEKGWQDLGFSANQARAIMNYVNKGGKFSRKEDLQKVYVISAEAYEQLAPFVEIAQPSGNTEKTSDRATSDFEKKEAPTMLTIDINTADTTGFMGLRGIGSVFANRIVRFREALGGFHSIDQLKEVYGLSAERYDSIHPSLFISAAHVKKIDINTLTAVELAKHPYIDRKMAKLIVRFREQHGPYRQMDDLRQIEVINEEFILKISPYLGF